MKNLFSWVVNLFSKQIDKKDSIEPKKSVVGLIKIRKDIIKNNTIVMNKDVYCVINVISDKNELIRFDYHLNSKTLYLLSQNKIFEYLKIEYIKNKK